MLFRREEGEKAEATLSLVKHFIPVRKNAFANPLFLPLFYRIFFPTSVTYITNSLSLPYANLFPNPVNVNGIPGDGETSIVLKDFYRTTESLP